MTELAESLCLNLTDTLTGYIKLLADFLKGSASAVLKTETEFENLGFTGSEG